MCSSNVPRLSVFCTCKLPEPARSILEAKVNTRFWLQDDPVPKEKIITEVKNTDGLLCLLTDPIDKEVIDAAENVKVISQVAVGYDNIDIKAATKRGIYVTNTPGVLTETTADLTWALLMTAARRIVEADNYVREGKWKIPWTLTMMLGSDVHGKTLGVIGLGKIGSAVSRRAKGFQMKILYHGRSRKLGLEKELDAKYVELETLLREADFVTLHVPLTTETRYMIREQEIKLMKNTSFLINTSRGHVVEEKALYKALKEGWIQGAALDVHTKEPIDPENPLLKLDNVVVSPHIGSASRETRTKMAVMAANNLVSVLEGRIPPNLVNKEVFAIRPLL